ncbi:hypothetical protein J7T55_000108, partial [Diaporthe amygdali]|uniref:uncharacterized protein n=1 Tax=Phomopsis amygdali TaxID=1214568 RepID=UPI0022FDC3B3
LWWEIALSFEAAVFKAAYAAFVDPKQSNETKKAAAKANRKGASIPNAVRASLELVADQSMTSFAAFSKAGCNSLLACGASAAMLCFPLLLQLRFISFMAEVSAHQRQKEAEVGTENTLRVYLISSRDLRLLDSCRRICVLFAFVLLVFIANPQEPQTFVLVLPLVLHTDEKLAKLWKAMADTESAWVFLHMQYPLPEQGPHQEITYNSISHPKPALEIPEAMERM